ncbi:hypothetical protein BDA96_04G338700 [Sorghum bicolor]|uniref:Knottin scorpion toxin-like domain-containing protein n=2 Tax=Sorghum bicolor TaxID=4558 RepID=A0A921R818_SORBI|nr:hypothetical protein BDA96_04G338700 [Sorghum bicolor]KXG31203.1 hypothetical protein SORBI_3004G316300 [Sorghum bicolor]
MTMGTYHGALLLIIAIMLSTGICTAPMPAPTPALSSEASPPTKHTCLKVFAGSGCNRKACHDDCFTKLKGNGVCLRDVCWCSYACGSQLPPPPA